MRDVLVYYNNNNILEAISTKKTKKQSELSDNLKHNSSCFTEEITENE